MWSEQKEPNDEKIEKEKTMKIQIEFYSTACNKNGKHLHAINIPFVRMWDDGGNDGGGGDGGRGSSTKMLDERERWGKKCLEFNSIPNMCSQPLRQCSISIWFRFRIFSVCFQCFVKNYSFFPSQFLFSEWVNSFSTKKVIHSSI